MNELRAYKLNARALIMNYNDKISLRIIRQGNQQGQGWGQFQGQDQRLSFGIVNMEIEPRFHIKPSGKQSDLLYPYQFVTCSSRVQYHKIIYWNGYNNMIISIYIITVIIIYYVHVFSKTRGHHTFNEANPKACKLLRLRIQNYMGETLFAAPFPPRLIERMQWNHIRIAI